MNNDSFKNLIDETAAEVARLLEGPLANDRFLTEVLNVLVECKSANYVVSENRKEQFRLLGAAAVRQFDSFDFVPEAGDFVGQAVALSKLCPQ